MGWWQRIRNRGTSGRRGASSPGTLRTSDNGDEKHLREFAAGRRGVEGFVEPQTTVTDVTLMLVAHDGEWTRRRVPSVKWAHEFCNKHAIPSYDAAVVGYPARMRAWNRRQKEQGTA